MGPAWSGHQKPEVPHSCSCGSPLKGCWQWPEAQPVAEVIPISVYCLLFCSLLFLPHGLAKAERQKITGMQYNPANQRETPCLSFSTLCLYLVFPFSEEPVPNISCFPRINQLAGCCGKKFAFNQGHGDHHKQGPCSCPQAQAPICFEGLGFTKLSGLERNS